MHLCIAGSVRAMPEKEKPPAMPVDIYCIYENLAIVARFRGALAVSVVRNNKKLLTCYNIDDLPVTTNTLGGQ